jgi:hypothetical protein
MALKNVHERLYSRSEAESKKEMGEEKEVETTAPVSSYGKNWKVNNFEKLKKEKQLSKLKKKRRKNKIILGMVGGLLFLILASFLSYLYIFREKDIFNQNEVVLSMAVPERIKSGDEVTYDVKIENKSESALQEAMLYFIKPDGFSLSEDNQEGGVKTLEVGGMGAGESKQFQIKGRMIGVQGSVKEAKVVFEYRAEVIAGSKFSNEKTVSVVIAEVPLVLEIEAYGEVVSGGEVTYLVKYGNFGDAVYKKMRLEIEYPEGFSYSGANVEPSLSNNVWDLGDLTKVDQPAQIEIKGKLEGSYDEVKILRAKLISQEGNVMYAEDKGSTKIARQAFQINQVINGKSDLIVGTGDELEYAVNYENTGKVSLSKTVITVELDSKVLDFKSIKVDGGSFDEASKKITWDASGVAELGNVAPSRKGQVNFTVKVLDLLPIVSQADKNFTVKSIVKIDSPDVPAPVGAAKVAITNEKVLRVKSNLILQAKGYYTDPSGVVNEGPIPPKVGQKTTYSIHWQLLNLANDVDGVKVVGKVPTGVNFEGQVGITGGKDLKYDERTRELIWEIGKVGANTGILLPALEVVYKVSVTPSSSQVDSEIGLTESDQAAVATGKDIFVNLDIEGKDDGITTDLSDDSTVLGKGEVEP